jgi:hypothetical protein
MQASRGAPPPLVFLFAAIDRACADMEECPPMVPPSGTGMDYHRRRKAFERARRKHRIKADAWAWLFAPTGLEKQLSDWGLKDVIPIEVIRLKARRRVTEKRNDALAEEA